MNIFKKNSFFQVLCILFFSLQINNTVGRDTVADDETTDSTLQDRKVNTLARKSNSEFTKEEHEKNIANAQTLKDRADEQYDILKKEFEIKKELEDSLKRMLKKKAAIEHTGNKEYKDLQSDLHKAQEAAKKAKINLDLFEEIYKENSKKEKFESEQEKIKRTYEYRLKNLKGTFQSDFTGFTPEQSKDLLLGITHAAVINHLLNKYEIGQWVTDNFTGPLLSSIKLVKPEKHISKTHKKLGELTEIEDKTRDTYSQHEWLDKIANWGIALLITRYSPLAPRTFKNVLGTVRKGTQDLIWHNTKAPLAWVWNRGWRESA